MLPSQQLNDLLSESQSWGSILGWQCELIWHFTECLLSGWHRALLLAGQRVQSHSCYNATLSLVGFVRLRATSPW